MTDQWIRQISVILYNVKNVPTTTSPQEGNPIIYNQPDPNSPALVLSDFKITFNVRAADQETPDHCAIRIYNLSKETVKRITGGFSSTTNTHTVGEFTDISLNAGYQGNFGSIFKGTIKQFRVGREDNLNSYVDIFAADGDYLYSKTISMNIPAAKTYEEVIQAISEQVETDIDTTSVQISSTNLVFLRGAVIFGMARAKYRLLANNLNASWRIENGKIIFMDNQGYREGEVICINAKTGLIGVPEQTDQGIKVTCLLNHKIRIGDRVQLNNQEITQLSESNPNNPPIMYNRLVGPIYFNPPTDADGYYRVFVVEHEGDTRGQNWYTHLICLAMTTDKKKTLG